MSKRPPPPPGPRTQQYRDLYGREYEMDDAEAAAEEGRPRRYRRRPRNDPRWP